MGLSDQVTELRAAFDTVQTEISAAADRVNRKLQQLAEKIASLGEADPDLSADVTEIMGEVEKLKAIAPEAAPAPEEPTEPEPTEEEPVP